MIPPGLEPGTFRVLGERDNHYTTESVFLILVLKLSTELGLLTKSFSKS